MRKGRNALALCLTTLAVDWDILVSELSRGKQKAMSGQQVGELFEKALVFANALFGGIDKTRLKLG